MILGPSGRLGAAQCPACVGDIRVIELHPSQGRSPNDFRQEPAYVEPEVRKRAKARMASPAYSGTSARIARPGLARPHRGAPAPASFEVVRLAVVTADVCEAVLPTLTISFIWPDVIHDDCRCYRS